MIEPYHVPAGFQRTETEVARSRFIASVDYAETAENAKAFIAGIRAEMPDASHHVYAFRAGFGASVTEGMSDDGEPSGTSGPPILAVLRGSDIGDIVLVVTRYFGGTKLGTGGLVRAYSEAAHVAINKLKTVEKIEKRLLGIEVPYSLFEQVKLLIAQHTGEIEDEAFAVDVTLMVRFAVRDISAFTADLRDLSAGRITPVPLD
ncbi:MAG: YigZ family protein [Anaerolineaceae bacterium]|nr:MAG: YigZ family protein [Anaerolineaceae bacterium]